jgi:tRNA (guanine37-N1)-methyltransferase
MKITYISIFPEIFESFLTTSLIKKAQEKELLSFDCVNPRNFCKDKHKQVDDEIYGG